MQSIKDNSAAELKIWDKICIIVGEGRDAGIYETRIEDIINGGIIVANPQFIAGRTLLRNGAPIVVQFTREDAAYQFHSRIRVNDDTDMRRVILTPPRGFQRVQRRNFARVNFPVMILYRDIPAGSSPAGGKKDAAWNETHAVNISAGGLLIKSPSGIREGHLVAFRINMLGEADLPTSLLAVCRRVFVNNGQSYAGFEFILRDDLSRHFAKSDERRLPVEYKQFDQKAQDRLVTYLFHKQIELRQKGLI